MEVLRGVVVVKQKPDRNTLHDNHDHKNMLNFFSGAEQVDLCKVILILKS